MAGPTKRERELSEQIYKLELIAEQAETEQKTLTVAVVARGKISNLRLTVARLKAERLAAREKDPLKRTRRLRRAATEAGNWQAVARFLQAEHDMEDRRAREKTRALADEAPPSPEEALEEIAAIVESLPQASLDRLAEVIERARNPRPRTGLRVIDGG